jgi:outer membrane receptor protein involved in Fe transport
MSHQYCQYLSGRLANNQLNLITTTMLNASQIETRGIDFSINYAVPIPNDFSVDVSFQGNILLKMEIDNSGEIENRLGTIANLSTYDGAFSKFRFLTDLTMGWKFVKLSNRVRFVGPVEYFAWKGDPADPWDDLPIHSWGGVAYWDACAILSWNELDFVVGLDNVLDKEPPFIPGGDGNSNPNSYDFVGRYIYASVGYQF